VARSGSGLKADAMPNVRIRYWAAAKEAAGLAEEPVSAATLAEALDIARGRHAWPSCVGQAGLQAQPQLPCTTVGVSQSDCGQLAGPARTLAV
jgi:hypothetical protein